jgi:prepilin-type N-terminal cleavage/methylation domain-containing protein
MMRSFIRLFSGSRLVTLDSGLDGRAGQPGFSLVEMVTVLALIAVLAAVAIPKWAASLRNYRLNQAANRVVADLLRAQRAAYASSSAKTVNFTVASSQYAMAGITDLKHPTSTYTVTLAEEPYQCTLVSVWGRTTTASLVYDGYGAPSCGGNIVIASGSQQKVIVVDAVSGAASVP